MTKKEAQESAMKFLDGAQDNFYAISSKEEDNDDGYTDEECEQIHAELLRIINRGLKPIGWKLGQKK